MADQITLTLSEKHLWSAVLLLGGMLFTLVKYVVTSEKKKLQEEIAAVKATQREQLEHIRKSLETLNLLIENMERNFHDLDKKLAVTMALQRGKSDGKP